MNVDEAAQYLKCSASYLNKLRLTGGGPVYAKLGSKVIYDVNDVLSWVQARKLTSTSQVAL
jgi:molybdenum cofactor biosynthesis enzyme MoaA